MVHSQSLLHNSMPPQTEPESESKLLVSFRGQKIEIQLVHGISVWDVKSRIVAHFADDSIHTTTQDEEGRSSSTSPTALSPSDIQLLYQGAKLSDDTLDLYSWLLLKNDKRKKTKKKYHNMMATGVSSHEARALQQEIQEGLSKAPRIREDITNRGKRELAQRKRLGQVMLHQAARRGNASTSKQYSFGKIETLPMLPNESRARAILTQLANDPGVLACMAKHQWNVGSLAELYPEGKVGQSDVCVMGLNKNKGQQILLRVRTDDLKGFRKLLSIKKVLFHELAHNVHSEHNADFFQLMRQVERECNELDWTQGEGLADERGVATLYTGGSYRLGGHMSPKNTTPVRELAARAAMLRLTAEEEQIREHCGCGVTVTTRDTTETTIDWEREMDGDDALRKAR